MTALILTRSDPTRKMARFYRMDVRPDLFGGWVLWREWGRIGSGGTVRHDAFSSREAADAAQAQLAATKARRGYGLGEKTQPVPLFD
jgi:predicted DNA-binding WGR domain protein